MTDRYTAATALILAIQTKALLLDLLRHEESKTARARLEADLATLAGIVTDMQLPTEGSR